ncbi:MAG: hypothetical protein MI867_17190, partial [Pseudomonadales bacterium]|nr:hypothetical protein [Pseudomonadales bacterium]
KSQVTLHRHPLAPYSQNKPSYSHKTGLQSLVSYPLNSAILGSDSISSDKPTDPISSGEATAIAPTLAVREKTNIKRNSAIPVPIEIDKCSTCTPIVFRDSNEDAGTLQHALDIIQAEHPDMLNYNVEYIQGVLIDLQGRTVLNDESFWEFLFSDDENLRAMRVTVRNDGSTYTRPSVFTDEDNYNGFITGHNGGRGLNGIKRPFTELLQLPLANSSDVVNQAINSNDYGAQWLEL